VDLKYVLAVARDCGKHITILVVTKSTVPVGTSQKVKQALQEGVDKRNVK
jgi:UDPglucose 6-dehydrogenase